MLTKRELLAGMAATGFGLATAQTAWAQTYPTRPVKIIVPLPAGSAPDVRHRLIAQALTQLWGQQVIIENRPGGGGIIGTRAMLGEQPDGYTLLAALASIYMILPAQNDKLPFDVNKDMIPIGLTAYEGLVMTCSPKLGVSTLADFLTLAKKMPDKLVIGTNPAGSLPHITAKLLVDVTKTAIAVVPYSTGGTSDAIRDILGGRVHAVIDGWASLRGAIESKDLTPLAIMSPKPAAILPNLPVASATVPGFTSIGWQTLTARRGTPDPVMRILGDSLRKVLADPQLQKRLEETGPEFQPLYDAELLKFIEAEQKFWLPLAKKYAN
ncbi:MAG: tripartite tricarboxylate transporter substrate binding protein [Xanthobacteraceae bacterium]|nr:tripartite tricarboxylate transporter substrate binding protein [Xanthobacteraceae bacterium]